MTKEEKKKNPIIVELGYHNPEFIYKRARRFPQFQHIGIDKKPGIKGQGAPENAELRQDYFDSGLEAFEEGELEGVNGRLSVGFYGKPPHEGTEEHTKKTAEVAFSRLKPGKPFKLVVDQEMEEKIREHLQSAGFENIRSSRVGEDTAKESGWMKLRHAGKIPMVRIRAVKPHRRK
jgi:hypothetical protein